MTKTDTVADRNALPIPGRRLFLQRLAALGALAAAWPPAVLAARRAESGTVADWVSEEPWRTLAAVQEHLLPGTPERPGAGDIQAIVYLRNTLEAPGADGGDRTFLSDGVGWLNEIAVQEYGGPFITLAAPARERLLRKIERSRAGQRWLSLLLTYLLEALLADPVYGANPGGMGWNWLAHQPGFPRPEEPHAWYRLAARRARPTPKAGGG